MIASSVVLSTFITGIIFLFYTEQLDECSSCTGTILTGYNVDVLAVVEISGCC